MKLFLFNRMIVGCFTDKGGIEMIQKFATKDSSYFQLKQSSKDDIFHIHFYHVTNDGKKKIWITDYDEKEKAIRMTRHFVAMYNDGFLK